MPDGNMLELILRLDAGDDAPADEVDRLARQLRAEVAEIEAVATVEPARLGPAPEGAKAGEALALGMLAITALPAALPSLSALLHDWLGRRRQQNPSLRITLESGGRRVEVVYDPAAMSAAELQSVLSLLVAAPPAASAALAVGGDLTAGQDLVGRDKLEAGGHIVHAEAGATVIIHPPPPETRP